MMRSPCNFACRSTSQKRGQQKENKKTKGFFSSHNCFFPKPKMIAPKNFFLLLRAPTSKQERLLLQSLAGQHKHQDFFIASCCGIVNTTISTFPQFHSDFVIRMCLLVVSGVLRRCRAASAVFPVPSQPPEEFLVVGCQQ